MNDHSRFCGVAWRLACVLVVLWLAGCSSLPPAESCCHRLNWSTASELNNFGYDIYRSESIDGPFEKITKEIIPGAGTTDVIQRYEYVDRSARADRAYYYYIESISESGRRQRFSPTVRVEALD